jgi:hypothetical protein
LNGRKGPNVMMQISGNQTINSSQIGHCVRFALERFDPIFRADRSAVGP